MGGFGDEVMPGTLSPPSSLSSGCPWQHHRRAVTCHLLQNPCDCSAPTPPLREIDVRGHAFTQPIADAATQAPAQCTRRGRKVAPTAQEHDNGWRRRRRQADARRSIGGPHAPTTGIRSAVSPASDGDHGSPGTPASRGATRGNTREDASAPGWTKGSHPASTPSPVLVDFQPTAIAATRSARHDRL